MFPECFKKKLQVKRDSSQLPEQKEGLFEAYKSVYAWILTILMKLECPDLMDETTSVLVMGCF